MIVDRKANPCVLFLPLLVCGALLLFACGRLCAQEYSFHTFGNAEGLGNLTVWKIYQDRTGFVWVSTENGVFRYDGERFEAFGPAQGLPLSDQAAFGDAPDGSLLVGGSFGLYRLCDKRFVKIAGIFKTVDWTQGIQTDGKGDTFLGTDAGLMELASEPGQSEFTVRRIPQAQGTSGPAAYGVLADGDSVWYGCGHELCRMDRNGEQVFGQGNGLPDDPVLSIRKDQSGNLWVQTSNASVLVLPAGGKRFQKPGPPVSDRLVNALSVDSDGRILLLRADGLLIQEGKSWHRIDRAAGLHGMPIAAFEDRKRTLWVGLYGQGLEQWRGYREWESYSTADGLVNDAVFEILLRGKTLWAGTMGGLVRGERRPAGIRWSKVPALAGVFVHSVRMAPDGALWLATERHLVARFDPQTGQVQWFGASAGLRDTMASTLYFDRERRLWVGTDTGLFMATAPYKRFVRVSQVPLSFIWTIAEGSDGTVWAGGAAGLFSFSGGRWRRFSRADGLSDQDVLSLGAGADGTIWVGYRSGGIDRVHPRANGLAVDKEVQRPGTNGLVYFLGFDALGQLWAGTEHGVDVWNGAHWSHYDAGDGLVWNDCNLNAFAAEPDGAVWIGTSGGLSLFRPRPRLLPAEALRVVFTSLLMGGKDVSGEEKPSLSTHTNSLVARFSALNAVRDNAVLFRYRLEGANSAWTETAQRELQFAELAPGEYRLEVEARDSDGAWSGQRAEFAFGILSPWYMSWWFFGLCGLIPVSASGAVMRWRMTSVARREHELNRLMKAHDEIRNLAFYDPLTGLPNRRLLLDRLSKTLAASARSRRLCALLFLDLDDFKTLNDTLGHQTGDLLLREVALRISATIRDADTVARLGGDEFVVMLEDLGNVPEVAAAHAKSIAKKILTAIGQPYLLTGRECLLTSSIGVTVFGDRQENTEEVLQQADIAMYQAKGSGRNTVLFFAPALQAAVNARAAMEEDLRLAIKLEQFVLYYQPQVDQSGLISAEALVRWKHPQRGIILPGEFIAMAEESGLILSLGDWVLEAACRQLAAWASRAETAHLTVSANVSARQFRQTDFVQRVLIALDLSGADPTHLKLELTESILVDNIEEVIAKMNELKPIGVQFSLDDFGTGYSSLSYLKHLPLDQLKIDRIFVRDILTDISSAAIAQAIIALGRAMDMSVMAEGVETYAQREFLAELGCHAFQGYLISPPVPAEEFELLLPHLAEMAGVAAR
jgi:diguanylate cyclase (GGDEF)-like protein